jgi:hypothetical protein
VIIKIYYRLGKKIIKGHDGPGGSWGEKKRELSVTKCLKNWC